MGVGYSEAAEREVVRLALLGLDATTVCRELGYARSTVLRIVRLAKKSGRVPKTIWGVIARIPDESREGVLDDWASCQYQEYEIALRNRLPPRYRIAWITERGRLRGDPRAIGHVERKVRLDAYLKSLVVVPPPRPLTLAEQMGIKIGPTVVYYNHHHQTATPRRNVITLSGGLVQNHA